VALRRGYGWLTGLTRTLLWLVVLSFGALGLAGYFAVDLVATRQQKRDEEFAERYLAWVSDQNRPQSWHRQRPDGSVSNRLYTLYEPEDRFEKTERYRRVQWTADLARRFPEVPSGENVKCIRHLGSNVFNLIHDCLPDEMK
jgi:hypothetical protein